MAIEQCLRKPESIVKYACATQKAVKKFVKPIMREIMKDCPVELVNPNNGDGWRENDTLFRFANGSEIQFAGTDGGNADNLRGGASELCICDEAGFMDDLDYVVNSVLAPTTDTTGGRIILSSTPNFKDPNHQFHTDFIRPFENEGKVIKYTLYDSPMVDENQINKIIARYPGGVGNPKFRCEYLVEVGVVLDAQVIPEFTPEIEEEIVKDYEMPPHFSGYVSCDPAVADLTAIILGYHDYDRDVLVICDEIIMGGAGDIVNTNQIAEKLRQKEKEIFKCPVTGVEIEPELRIMDNSHPILINDLRIDHNIRFQPTKKDDKLAQVDNVRRMIQDRRLEISPNCKVLIHHIKTTVWKATQSGAFTNKFDRVRQIGAQKAHHGDALDALIYLVRNFRKKKNPYPAGYGELTGENIHRNTPISRINENIQKWGDSLMGALKPRKKK